MKDELFVIIHANKIWGELYFEEIELARNYIAFRIKNYKEQGTNIFLHPFSGAKYEIKSIRNYQQEIKRT